MAASLAELQASMGRMERDVEAKEAALRQMRGEGSWPFP